MNTFRLVREGQDIIILVDGRYVTEFSWQVADEIAKQLKSMARVCEQSEPAVIQRAVQDQAVLNDAGIPLVLHSRKVMEEAAKQTPFKGVASSSRVFKPTIIQGAPR